jgi:3-hydroxyisobutyrate dehydrogenase-like beta-hydroxyacid dehydrogenase
MAIARIGVVGLGSMGSAMAQRLVDAGFDVTVSNRTQATLAHCAPPGARTATLPADAAQDADLVVVSVKGEAAVEEVLFDHGSIGETLRDGGYIVDTSTTSPPFSRAATARLAAYGLTRVEACILGDPARARLGQLQILFGGAPEDLGAVAEVVGTLARSVVHTGPVGTASKFTALHQSMVADGFTAAAQEMVRELATRPLGRASTLPACAGRITARDLAEAGAASARG